ncbi:prolipoprotein diacylglyceryl transferase [Segatella bryantii]|uniref:prolipoprotein diacylglyceryl transferase n=1 Tax=Segatella bryantii TaxID=77095 RepID=UPI001EDB2ACB|nr:prolipoprotein diacylglyceryl transferase [Segatella bryantii]UKK74390.1 prolipoprotein diacylglyceryl transferase [Segatella bryantii]
MFTDLVNYIVWNPDPIIGSLGPITLRYYSLCWIIGLALGYVLMQKLYRQQKLSDEQFEPLFIYIFLAILLGARLGHCLFYEPDYFLSSGTHLLEMLLPARYGADGSWHITGYEGLASHGGVFGLFVGLWLYCRNFKVPGWVVLDNMGICSSITAFFIRLGNLMNSEIIGKVTDVPWAFIFARVDGYPRHPGQLYEAICYLLFFFIILIIYKKKGSQSIGSGLYFGLCLTLIFIARFFIEYTKEIQVAFESSLPMDMGQILSIPLIIIGVYSIATSGKRMKLKEVIRK